MAEDQFNPWCVEARLLGFCLQSSRYIVADFRGRLTLAEFTCSRGVGSIRCSATEERTSRCTYTWSRSRATPERLIFEAGRFFWRTGRQTAALLVSARRAQEHNEECWRHKVLNLLKAHETMSSTVREYRQISQRERRQHLSMRQRLLQHRGETPDC